MSISKLLWDLRPVGTVLLLSILISGSQAVAGSLGEGQQPGNHLKITEVSVDFDTVLATQRLLMSVEAAAVHEENFRTRADDFAPVVRELIEMGMITPGVAYVQAQRARRRFRREMEQAIGGFDVLLTPSTPAAAPRDRSTTGDPMFQSPWTTCGLPTISLPSGLNGDDLPLGIQLAGAPFDEGRLLAAAHWCERVLDFKLTPVG